MIIAGFRNITSNYKLISSDKVDQYPLLISLKQRANHKISLKGDWSFNSYIADIFLVAIRST